MQYAYQMGADWTWCMGDDVFPCTDCLEQLLLHSNWKNIKILAPRRLQEGGLFMHEFQGCSLISSLVSVYTGKLSEQAVTEPVEIQGAAFEGPLIRRRVAKKIGCPNKELFVFCDDTDYCLRTVQAGFKILCVPTVLIDEEKFFSDDSWSKRNKKKKRKRFYQVRNSTYSSHHYGRNWAVRYLQGSNRATGYILMVLLTCPPVGAYQWGDIAKLWKAYCDGIHERLGKM